MQGNNSKKNITELLENGKGFAAGVEMCGWFMPGGWLG